MIFWFALLCLLVCMSAFFSGMEVAFVSMSRLRIKSLMRKKIPGADAVYRIKHDQHRLLIAILVGNNTVNITAASIATYLAIEIYGSTGVGIATGLMTFILLVFGEITPKNLASVYAEEISLVFARPFEILLVILTPLIFVFEVISNSFVRIFGKKAETPIISEDYLRAMFDVGVEEEVLEPQEKEYLERVLKFKTTAVKTVMTPKNEIFSLPETMKIEETARLLAKKPYSRIPIVRKDGKIRGVVYAKDLLSELSAGFHQRTLKEIAKPLLYVRDDVMTDSLFRHFQKKGVHMALIVDQSNSVVGLITLEDLVEEIVGDIFDEQDLKKRIGA